MSHFTLGVVNVRGGECRGGECRTIGKMNLGKAKSAGIGMIFVLVAGLIQDSDSIA